MNFSFFCTKDKMTPRLKAAFNATSPEGKKNCMDAAGRGMVNFMRVWFYGLDDSRANSLSSNRSHFWGSGSQGMGGVAKSVNHTATTADATAIAFAPGIPGGLTHTVTGGTVLPRHAKALTIPVHPDAYNRRAREIDGLKLIWPPGQGFGLLVQESDEVYHAHEKTASGTKKKLVKRKGPMGADYGVDFTGTESSAKRREGTVFYMLFKSVTHDPDPSVLPPVSEVFGAAKEAMADYFNHVKVVMQS